MDFGLELTVLVYHLFQKYDKNPEKAFYELTLRTRSCCAKQDAELAQSIDALPKTFWHEEMVTRYQAMISSVRDKNKETINEMQNLVETIYPNGCATSEFVTVVETCTSLLPFTIHSEHVTKFLDKQSVALHSDRIFELSKEDLTCRIIDDLLIESMVPRRWWQDDHTRSGRNAEQVKVTKIALGLEPLEIVVEYKRQPWGVRSRRIQLKSVLSLDGPTSHIARRLAQSHDSLVEERVFQRLLIRLQHLASKRQAQEGEKIKAARPRTKDLLYELEHVVPELPAKTNSEDSLDTSFTSRGKPRKADLGLLYRDPTKALENVDLNDADEYTTKEFKEFMDKNFQKISIKPGDPGYVYDKRIDVNPTKKSGWDDLDSD